MSVDFGRSVVPTRVGIQFQAGFAAEEVTVMVFKSEEGDATSSQAWEKIDDFEVEDDHEMQFLDLVEDGNAEKIPESGTTAIKLIFDECTDFYGRVTIYQLKVFGREVASL